jgi:DNA polymerase-3 subunit epsilon
MKRIVCIDTETTGFDYSRGERIIEIAGVEIIDGVITGSSFHEYINPDGKIIPPDSYMVHKLSNEFLSDKPKMAAVAPKFLDFIGDSTLVAHNGMDFDYPFINYELAQLRLKQIPREQQTDSIVIARNRVYGPKSYTLDSLAKWFGVSLVARADAHGALIDAEILAKVYLELENTAPARPISEIIAEQHAAMLNHPRIGSEFPHRTFAPREDELTAHNAFVAGFRG